MLLVKNYIVGAPVCPAFLAAQADIVRRVELDIGRAEPHQRRDFLAQEIHHVREEVFQGFLPIAARETT